MNPVDDVRDRLDIVAVISDYVQLKKAGRIYKGLCPFHGEKTPSFVVYPDSGNWRCFGACATGGDAFDFVMRAENMDFKGALEVLAGRVGVALLPPSPVAQEKRAARDRLYDVLAAAMQVFHRQLMRGSLAEAGRAYLSARGFTGDVARAFHLGWAADDWSNLTEALRAEGYTEAEMLAAGVVRERDSGGVFDMFRGRLIIPICDAKGRPVGFGARTVVPGEQPKYINSPQSEVFDKSRLLFGLHRAARAIRESEIAVVVEGYTDVIRAHAAGFENVVASMGTALTEPQLGTLKRYASTIVLALDADAAGQAATLRGLEVAQQSTGEGGVVPVPTPHGWVRYEHRLDLDLRVAVLPPGKDPDDVVQSDPALWRQLIADARPVMVHLFDVLTAGLDLSQPGDKTTAADRLLPIVAEIPDPISRSAWLSKLAETIHIDERVLVSRLKLPSASSTGSRGRAGGGGGSRRAVSSTSPLWSDQARRGDAAPDGSGGSSLFDQPPMVDLDEVPFQALAQPAIPRIGRGDRAAYLLAHLIQSPKRLHDLNAELLAHALLPLEPHDFERADDRDLLEAVRYAVHGAPPPDLPQEHRLDALPEPLARYAAALRLVADGEPVKHEGERLKMLHLRVLDLRKRTRNRQLPGLGLLYDESEGTSAEDRDGYMRRALELVRERGALDRLVEPDGGQEHGKLDRSVGR